MKLIRRKACYDSLKAKFEQCLGPHAPLPLPPANMVRWKGDEIIGGASLGETKTFFFFCKNNFMQIISPNRSILLLFIMSHVSINQSNGILTKSLFLTKPDYKF